MLCRLPGVEWTDAGDVVGLGLTLRPTPHRLGVEGRTLFTWCALDTLFFPAMLGKAARVTSPCPITGAEIRVEVTPEGVERLEPSDAVVSVVVPESAGDIRRTFCRNVHLFSAPEAASVWLSQHPGAVVLPVATAFQLGRLVARYLDESP
ncbi:MAG: alkylmercury lyase MerB [Armatimonadota bacterium]|nr:alkylmercury lyase MerB [Armatimonadota bacterium]